MVRADGHEPPRADDRHGRGDHDRHPDRALAEVGLLRHGVEPRQQRVPVQPHLLLRHRDPLPRARPRPGQHPLLRHRQLRRPRVPGAHRRRHVRHRVPGPSSRRRRPRPALAHVLRRQRGPAVPDGARRRLVGTRAVRTPTVGRPPLRRSARVGADGHDQLGPRRRRAHRRVDGHVGAAAAVAGRRAARARGRHEVLPDRAGRADARPRRAHGPVRRLAEAGGGRRAGLAGREPAGHDRRLRRLAALLRLQQRGPWRRLRVALVRVPAGGPRDQGRQPTVAGAVRAGVRADRRAGPARAAPPPGATTGVPDGGGVSVWSTRSTHRSTCSGCCRSRSSPTRRSATS